MPGGGQLTIGVTQEGDQALLSVTDTGRGLASEDLERVFERFTRGSTSAGGTGLGLAIARWAVELHGGTIEVMEVGTGCRIAVTIPASEAIEETV